MLNKVTYGTISDIENYMSEHGFRYADKQKVRRFIKSHKIKEGTLTGRAFYYRDIMGRQGMCSRDFLGIKENLK